MQLGVIVIGAGDMGSKHARHWQTAGANVIAVCDPDLGRAQVSAELVGADAVADYKTLLARADIHAVSVCTPTFLHPNISIDCLKAAKHVLCEKPIALTIEDAKRMKAAAEKNKRELRIGFMRRFDPAVQVLREKLDKIGQPVFMSVQIPAGIRPKHAMHDTKANGGPIIDMLCHHFDMWHDLFGYYPKFAYAAGQTFAQNKTELERIQTKAIDTALIVLEFPKGHTASIHVSWGLPAGVPITEHYVYTGPEGLLKVDWNNEKNRIAFYDNETPQVWHEESDGWQHEIAQFYKELTQSAPRLVANADDGIKALELSLEILDMIEERLESLVLDAGHKCIKKPLKLLARS